MPDRSRRVLLWSLLAAPLPLSTVAAQPAWWAQERRRAEYERWREREMLRREREGRRRRREWRRDAWEEERERAAWARRQRWYRGG